MDNNSNDLTENQSIPGVKVAMPSDKPVDATTVDKGAALSNAVRVNNQVQQPVMTSAASIQSASVSPTIPVPQTSQPVLTVQPASGSQISASVMQPVALETVMTNATGNSNNVESVDGKKKKEKKPKNKLARFYFFIIVLLVGGCCYLWYYHQQQMIIMNQKCTPVSTSGEVKELDLNSTIVKDLYSKVATNIREDLASTNFDDQMKVYLAYRQIGNSNLYESNCNKFSTISMEPFACEVTATFVPKAFKANVLQVELKKLFGEDTNINNQNVQLGNKCVGGYQYIEERGEYVQGQCTLADATLYRVEKQLISATSRESIIELVEQVKYFGNESLNLPDRLVSGKYKYTFKLDMNYNYIYVSKELIS